MRGCLDDHGGKANSQSYADFKRLKRETEVEKILPYVTSSVIGLQAATRSEWGMPVAVYRAGMASC